MSYETHIVDMGRGVHKFGIGIVTSAEILANALERTIDAKKKGENSSKYALVDFTGTTEFQVTSDTVMQLFEINRKLAQYTGEYFVATVAPDSLAFGMSRLWSSMSKDIGWESQVFRDRESAKAWLRTKLGHGNPDACSLDDFPSLAPAELPSHPASPA
jgi:hypothetical protein